MNIIVAVDEHWAIGYKDRLLVSIPNDQKHFREETTGKVVVLGRKTLQTFPQGQPLQNIYRQLLPYCDTAHVTKIDHTYEADSHFPNLDEDPEWEITADSDEQTYFDLAYTFVKYERKQPALTI